MHKLLSKIRLRRNELLWRFVPKIMFDHYVCQPDRGFGKGSDSYPTIGIFRDFMGLHQSYIKAAEDIGVRYQIIDLISSDWLAQVKASECTLFFVWPNPFHSAWKTLYDDRITVIERELKRNVYPRLDEFWIWESKRRMAYWLEAHAVKHPKTWVLYDYDEAISFAQKVELPVVFKPDFGDCARGIKIVRKRSDAVVLAKNAFHKGFHVEGHHPNDRVWGCVIFQEFIGDAREWRLVKIGDSLFCQLKGKLGDFHSGTRLVEYENPPKKLLDFAIEICDKGNFDCMSLDILEDKIGNFYVLELQTVFGIDAWIFYMAIDGIPGRYIITNKNGKHEYVFEKGVFCENDCCNLRIRDGIL